MQENLSNRAILLASIIELHDCLNNIVLNRELEQFEGIKATLLERVDRLNGDSNSRHGDPGIKSSGE